MIHPDSLNVLSEVGSSFLPKMRQPGLSKGLEEGSEKFEKVIERSVRGTDEGGCAPC